MRWTQPRGRAGGTSALLAGVLLATTGFAVPLGEVKAHLSDDRFSARRGTFRIIYRIDPDRRRARARTFVRLAHRRLGQSHAFAAIPDPDGRGYRVIVSRAGDRTARLIDSPPGRLWVRGVPVDGVASVAPATG